MQVFPPTVVTLDATNIPASSYSEWSSVTNYVAGNNVRVTTAVPHREYRALQASLNKPPATEPAYWSDLGATNQYRLLDDSSSTQTTATTSFYSTLIPAGTPTHLALFGMTGVLSVRIEVTFEGAVVYDVTHTLEVLRETASWWEFFFGLRAYQSSLLVPVGGWYGGEFKLTFTGDTGATVGVGHVALGIAISLGETLYGANLAMTQYSTKEADEWGNIVLVRRVNAKVASVKLLCNDAQVDHIYRTLEALDATPAAWDLNNTTGAGEGYDSFRIWGIADFRILLESHNGTYCELDVTGLI
jgi:hypothetical protein